MQQAAPFPLHAIPPLQPPPLAIPMTTGRIPAYAGMASGVSRMQAHHYLCRVRRRRRSPCRRARVPTTAGRSPWPTAKPLRAPFPKGGCRPNRRGTTVRPKVAPPENGSGGAWRRRPPTGGCGRHRRARLGESHRQSPSPGLPPLPRPPGESPPAHLPHGRPRAAISRERVRVPPPRGTRHSPPKSSPTRRRRPPPRRRASPSTREGARWPGRRGRLGRRR